MMKHSMLSVLAFSVVAIGIPAVAYAESRYDVEIARLNARAGGPVSEYDYEVLERWGHLSEIDPRRLRRIQGRKHYYYDDDFVEDRRWRR